MYVRKIINFESWIKHPQRVTHNELAKCLQTKHTIEKSIFFDGVELFNKYITKHNKKYQIFP